MLCSRALSLFHVIACHNACVCSYAGAHVYLLDSTQHVPDPKVPGHLGQCDVSGWQSDAGPAGNQKVRLGVGHGPRVGIEILCQLCSPNSLNNGMWQDGFIPSRANVTQ